MCLARKPHKYADYLFDMSTSRSFISNQYISPQSAMVNLVADPEVNCGGGELQLICAIVSDAARFAGGQSLN